MPETLGQPPAGDDEPLLDVAESAARAGMKPSSWRSGVSRGYLPDPDIVLDADTPKERQRPHWHPSTVDAFIGSRPGPGHRSDLDEVRKERVRSRAAELAENRATDEPDMQEWLRTHHRALLAVADAIVDHRDALLAGVGDDGRRQDLALAIDRAGEAISGRPSRILASAVTYAQFLLRAIGGTQAPEDVREVLALHAHLHAEFNRLRDQGGLR